MTHCILNNLVPVGTRRIPGYFIKFVFSTICFSYKKKLGYRQCFRSVFIWYGYGSSILRWITSRIQSEPMVFMTKNFKKFTAKRKLNFFGSKIPIYLSLVLQKDVQATEEAFSPQKRRNILHFIHEISYFFLLLWVFFALLDPDPDPESGYGSVDLTESGSETLPIGTYCDKKTLNCPEC